MVRGEMKRAIFDLPDETRANADAMRRVVSDQIVALNALADVVKRQAANIDISGPGIILPPGRDNPPGKSKGAGSNAPPSETSGALEAND